MTHIEPQASRQGISLARAASGPDGLAQTAKQTLFGAAPLRTFFCSHAISYSVPMATGRPGAMTHHITVRNSLRATPTRRWPEQGPLGRRT